MFVVYILYSDRCGKHYTGFTSNLEARLQSHNGLSSKGWTTRCRPWRLIHTEHFSDKKEAMEKELWFKSGVGREFVKTLPH